jgi:hypothetical protein
MAAEAGTIGESTSGHIELYRVLGLTSTGADAVEIKRAYRKLSLKFHPDRNPGDRFATEAFQRLNAANTILSDPQRRRVYDSFGMKGIELYEAYATSLLHAHDGESHNATGELPVEQLIASLCCAGSMLVFAIGGYACLLVARVSGRAGWPWTLVLVPLWLADAALLLRELPRDAAASAHAFAQLVYTCSHVACALKLDGHLRTVRWTLALAPLVMREAFVVASAMQHGWRTRAVGGNELASLLSAVNQLWGCCARAGMLVLIALKADGRLAEVWWGFVLLPAWAGCAAQLALNALAFASARREDASPRVKGVYEEARRALALACASTLGALALTLGVVTGSALPALLPVLAPCALYLCCCGCFSATLLAASSGCPPARDVPGPYGPDQRSSEARGAPSLRVPRSAKGSTARDSLLASSAAAAGSASNV